jgi:hypothetical protein
MLSLYLSLPLSCLPVETNETSHTRKKNAYCRSANSRGRCLVNGNTEGVRKPLRAGRTLKGERGGGEAYREFSAVFFSF